MRIQPTMTLKLCSIAAALALAVGTTAATFAQAQSTMSKDTATAAPPSADRKVKNAEEDRIEADAKAAKAKCETMKDNAKDVCEKEAKAHEKVAKAELNAKNNPTPSNDDMKGNEKNACQKAAKAKHEQAKADIKKQYAQKEAKSSSATTGSTSK